MTQRSRTTRCALLVCALGGALGTQAQAATATSQNPATACDPPHSTPLPDTLALVPLCENNAAWLTTLGERLLAENRYTEASEHLERALLLQPNSLPAAMAYAIALAGSSDLTSAMQLVTQITQWPDLPPAAREQLVQAQLRMANPQAAGWATLQPVGWQHRQSVGLRVGHDNNLLGAPRLSNLTLTLPGGDVSLPVDTTNLPRPGTYQRADVRTDHTHTSASGRRTEISATLLHRNSPAATSANTTQADLVLDTQPSPTSATLPLWATASAAALHTLGGTSYQSNGLGAGWAWAQAQCGQRLGAEWQRRNLSSNTVLSGTYMGLTGSWSCQTGPASQATPWWQPQQWQLSSRLGTDHPTHTTRPGGSQQQLGLRATARWQQWLLDADAQHSRDASGYSPILGNNTRRHTTRLTLRAEHHTPLTTWGQGLTAVWGAEMYRQKATLDLFKIHSINIYMAVRKQW